MNIENPNGSDKQHPFDKEAAEGWDLISSGEADALKQRLANRIEKRYAPQKSRRVPLFVLAAAAMIALLCCFWFMDIGPVGNNVLPDLSLAGSITVPTMPLQSNRTAQSQQLKQLKKGTAAYEKKDYSRAARFFEQFVESGGQQTGLQLYLGHSLLFDQPEKAITVLNEFLNTTKLGSNYKDYAHWYLAAAYWELGKAAQAKEHWTFLSSSETLFKAQATEQLRTRF